MDRGIGLWKIYVAVGVSTHFIKCGSRPRSIRRVANNSRQGIVPSHYNQFAR